MSAAGELSRLDSLAWPVARLGEAIEALARQSRLGPVNRPGELSRADEALALDGDLPEAALLAGDRVFSRWLDITTSRLGLEVEPIEAPYSDVDNLIRRAGPALLRLPSNGRFLALLKGGWQVALVAPDLSVRWVRPGLVREALCAELEAPLAGSIDRILAEAGVPEARRPRARAAILRERLGPYRLGSCWLLRLAPGAPLLAHLQHARLGQPLLALLGGQLVQQFLRLGAWWLIGRGAFQGRFDWTWLVAWALILFSAIPFHLLTAWGQRTIAVNVGGVFKRRLLHGTMQLEPEEVRHQGAGQFLGRVMESEAVEMLVLGGGFRAVMALIELMLAAAVLSLGAGGWSHSLLLLGWTGLTLVLGWRYFRHGANWVNGYQQMTNDLVERMVGHRTRLAQEDRQHWHDEEDFYLANYLKLSEKVDRAGIGVDAFAPRGWMIVALSGLAYTFIAAPNSPAQLAISLGGILMAMQALHALVDGLMSVTGAALAWRQVGPLFQAASRTAQDQATTAELSVELGQVQAAVGSAGEPNPAGQAQPILLARDLIFRYRDRSQPVLRGCNLRINRGDRLLLEGPSGGGKSTLATLLAGLRLPESGLLMLWGFDRQTLGAAEWRRRVVVVPQFHENHVLSETFSFNLLMGRRWPPLPEDLEEAETICRELGLGELLDRMPAGFQQMVGESGWRLSHGERSRLYIARALLQKADLIIMDESFAALDPENLCRALQCALRRAPTLLVIAHP